MTKKTVHKIVQDEHLASIARDHQRESFAKIWNDPDNEELRGRRESPHQLLPGDRLVIPERQARLFRKPTGQEHTFTMALVPLKLRLRVLDEYGEPIKSTAGTLTVNGEAQEVRTDGDGVIEVKVENGARFADLALGERGYKLIVGHLDPIDEPSGQLARLKGLGYYDGDVIEAADFEKSKRNFEVEIHLAWELFQDENGLTPTGKPDAQSVDKLKEVFGT